MPSIYLSYNILRVLVIIVIEILVPSRDARLLQFRCTSTDAQPRRY